MKTKELAEKLAFAETEEEIIALLDREGYWSNFDHWRPFGDNDNNFSTIGNQQSRPDAALVEKLINSVDAILMKECYKSGIDIIGPAAPQSMAKALETFYGIKNGQISYLDKKTRNDMSKNIILAATGKIRGGMNLVIADQGEGQTPNSMPETILSISRNNKLKVPFVQGKFNMGGTGALPFCGKNRFQVIISRRCPDIVDKIDLSHDMWSITVVRREEAREGRKSTMYTYLTDKNKNLLRFNAPSLQIIPTTNEEKPYEKMEYGTFIKLFDYGIQGYKSNILFDFNYRLSMLMPNLAHPIRLRECRKGYSGHTFETTLAGLEARLSDDRQNNIENGFPNSNTFNIDGQNFGCSIYLFQSDKASNYREKDGVLFVVNGQTHACLSDTFFNRVNLSYLAKDLLVIIDCSELDISHREDLFMNSRDRLRSGDFSRDIESRLKEILIDHAELKRIQNERRASAIQNKIADDKPLQNVLQNILSKSPVLSKILLVGSKLSSPFSMTTTASEGNIFAGKKHPTYFKIKNKNSNDLLIKTIPINHNFRVQFETDVENDYFTRQVESGKLILSMNDVLCPQLIRHLGLFNGIATLTINMPASAITGEKYVFKTKIEDECIVPTFENTFTLIIGDEKEYGDATKPGQRIPPISDKDNGNRQQPGAFAIPRIIPVYENGWRTHGMCKESALVVYLTNDASDYFINMDNIHLLTELKAMKDVNRIALTQARYKYSMALIGMGVISYYRNANDQSIDVQNEVKNVTSILSPIIIPLLDTMANLDDDLVA